MFGDTIGKEPKELILQPYSSPSSDLMLVPLLGKEHSWGPETWEPLCIIHTSPSSSFGAQGKTHRYEEYIWGRELGERNEKHPA